MKTRTIAILAVAIAVCVTLGMLWVSGKTNAQQGLADKAVTAITFDQGNNYPNVGTPITGTISIKTGQPQTMISVTSMDQLLAFQSVTPPLDSLVGFYADIPPNCWGRWNDPGNYFPADIYTVNGQPTAEPLSLAQLGTPVPATQPKVPGDQDNNPLPPGPGLPVAGETFEVDLHFLTSQYDIHEVVGPPVPITRFFDFHCDLPGTYVFWLCNKIEPMPPYTDPDFTVGQWPGNNVLCAPLTVQATAPVVGGIAEAPDAAAGAAATSTDGQGSSSLPYAAIAGAGIAVVLAIAAGGWYARRRWLT